MPPDFPTGCVIPGFPCQGIGAIGGPPDSGQSILATALSLAIALGADTPGATGPWQPPADHGSVTYIAARDDRATLSRRLALLAHAGWITEHTFDRIGEHIRFMVCDDLSGYRLGAGNRGELARVLGDAAQRQRLIVIDPIARFVDPDGHHPRALRTAVGLIHEVIRDSGASVLLVHERPLPKPIDTILDWKMELKPGADGNHMILHTQSRRDKACQCSRQPLNRLSTGLFEELRVDSRDP